MDIRDTDNLFSTEIKSKITKIYIEKLYHMKEIHFLTTLCPHMKCFKTNWIQETYRPGFFIFINIF